MQAHAARIGSFSARRWPITATRKPEHAAHVGSRRHGLIDNARLAAVRAESSSRQASSCSTITRSASSSDCRASVESGRSRYRSVPVSATTIERSGQRSWQVCHRGRPIFFCGCVQRDEHVERCRQPSRATATRCPSAAKNCAHRAAARPLPGREPRGAGRTIATAATWAEDQPRRGPRPTGAGAAGRARAPSALVTSRRGSGWDRACRSSIRRVGDRPRRLVPGILVLRHRHAGARRSDPADADALYDSTKVAHDMRWDLPLPSPRGHAAVTSRTCSSACSASRGSRERARPTSTSSRSSTRTCTARHSLHAPDAGLPRAIGAAARRRRPAPLRRRGVPGRHLPARREPAAASSSTTRSGRTRSLAPFDIARAPVTKRVRALRGRRRLPAPRSRAKGGRRSGSSRRFDRCAARGARRTPVCT